MLRPLEGSLFQRLQRLAGGPLPGELTGTLPVGVLMVNLHQVGEQIRRISLHPADLSGEKGQNVQADAHNVPVIGDSPRIGSRLAPIGRLMRRALLRGGTIRRCANRRKAVYPLG